MSKRKQTSIFESFSKVRKTASTTLPSLVPCAIEEEQQPDDALPLVPEPTCAEINAKDISTFVTKETLSDEDRYSILTQKFKPEKNWKGPLRQFGDKMRRVPALVFDQETYPTLAYSKAEDGAYCADCVAFSPAKVILSSKPLTDWKNAKKLVDKHIASSDHRTAHVKASAFLKICKKEEPSIPESLNKHYQDTVTKNRAALTSIIKTIVLCGQQNIPLRKGNDEDYSNFMALLRYRAETDKDLRNHLQNAPKNAKYICHSIQNELIQLCGKQIRDDLVKEVKESSFYTLIADECADNSTTEQISLCIRYVIKESGQHTLKEQFMTFIPTRDVKGETIANKLMHELTILGLDACVMVGQGYDGAPNMNGNHKGVKAHINQHHKHAVYVHCRNHQLNLAICKSCQVPVVRTMYETSSEVLTFITASPKRLQVYLGHSDNTRLKKFCATRWSTKTDSIHVLLENLSPILNTLEDLQEDDDAKTRSNATSLYNSITSFTFIVSLVMVEAPMQHLVPLCNMLQDTQANLLNAAAHASSTIKVLEKKRNEGFQALWDKACQLADDLDIKVGMPRQAKRQGHRSNVPSVSPEQYWRLNLFYPFLDHLLSELRDRLCTPQPRLAAQLLLPPNIKDLTTTAWEGIKEEFIPVIPQPSHIDSELENWKQAIEDSLLPSSSDIPEVLDAAEHIYPNIYTILKVLLAMPVSTATAERSFSAMKRLKTYLRNNMGHERMSSLALMNIHQKRIICTDTVLRDFDSSGHRRIALAFSHQ